MNERHGNNVEKDITILPSFEILLTGGQAQTAGKWWRLKKAYTRR